jgi:hypothetical protein
MENIFRTNAICPHCSGKATRDKPNIMLEIILKPYYADINEMHAPIGPARSSFDTGGSYHEIYFCESCGTTFKPTAGNGLKEQAQKEEGWKYFYSLLDREKFTRVSIVKDLADFRESICCRFYENEEFELFKKGDEQYEKQVAEVFKKGRTVFVAIEEKEEIEIPLASKQMIVPNKGLIKYSKNLMVNMSPREAKERAKTDGVFRMAYELNKGKPMQKTVKNADPPPGAEYAAFVCIPDSRMQYYVFVIPKRVVKTEH